MTTTLMSVINAVIVIMTVPFYLITISLDRLLAASGLTNPLLRGVPRNANDIDRKPQTFFRLLCKPHGTLPSGAQLLSLQRTGGVSTEPGKDKSVR
jgi:hypothetical protein